MKVAPCRGCRQLAVSTSSICVHCGTRNPVSIGRAGNVTALLAGVLVFAAILAVLFVVL